MTKLKKLHLGCGTVAPLDWINIDSSWNAWLAKYPFLRRLIKMTGLVNKNLLDISWPKNILMHDLTKPLPFKDNSIDCIYSSHILEHLYLEQAKKLLKECGRVLKSRGIVRIIVPDLKAFSKDYLSNQKVIEDEWETNADRFMGRLHIKQPSTPKNFIHYVYSKLNDTDSHKWMYDEYSLRYYLKKFGFKKIKKRKVNKSKIYDIKKLEQPERLNDAICMEAEKED